MIYPVAAPDVLQSLVEEFTSNGTTYRHRVHKVLRRSYLYHYRRMLPQLLELLDFRSNNTSYQPIIESLRLLKKYANSSQRYFPADEKSPTSGKAGGLGAEPLKAACIYHSSLSRNCSMR